eukprot:c28822_g2_i4 orf=1188-3749(-)
MEGADVCTGALNLSKVSQSENSLANHTRTNGATDRDVWGFGMEKKSSMSSLNWSKMTAPLHVNEGTFKQSISSLRNGDMDKTGPFLGAGDTDVFSSSLPALFNEKLNLSNRIDQPTDRGVSYLIEETRNEQLGFPEELESQAIGELLPDDEEELLADIANGFDFLNSSNNGEESEDFDLFSSGGGLEMDGDNSQEGFEVYMNSNRGLDNFSGGSMTNHGSSNGPASVIGEHPYGEHPSRTLFVRNINSNVEDSELRALFEQYGAIRTLYTACKHRGFVMISYYDIRDARSAMRALQNKPLRRRKLDIHFSIPKDNPSDKDINQGTLVVFNLDASVSNDDLRHIFGAYGEVKEIRETPHKRHHKFIEFYDVRAAEAALRALNRSDIGGKRIKLEPSRPGGARRSLMQQLSHELEQEEIRVYRQLARSPHPNSPPGYPSFWGHVGSPVQSGSIQDHHSFGIGTLVPAVNKPLVGLPTHFSYVTSGRVGTIGGHLERNNQIEASQSPGAMSVGVKPIPVHHPHSFPEYSNGFTSFYSPDVPVSVQGASALHRPRDGKEGIQLPRTVGGAANDISLFEHAPGGSGGSGPLSGTRFLWGNANHYQHALQNSPPVLWSSPTNFSPAGHMQPQSYGYSGSHGHFVNRLLSSHQHQAGSAPSGDPSILERHLGYLGESPDTSFQGPGSVGPVGLAGNNGGHAMNVGGGRGVLNPAAIASSASANMGIISPRHMVHMFPTGGFLTVSGSPEVVTERGRIRRTESITSQVDTKKQYQLDIDRILRGEDIRTTLMIKNIPNKYNSTMLLAAIDENHRGTYDFFYLPIDFKNKCNVGYAFINLTSPQHIIPFYQVCESSDSSYFI